MKIKKIQLKNGYKRFHNLTINLGDEPKRIIALVGANGCGKSSIFDGMLFLHNAHGQIGNTGAKNHEYHSMHNSPGFNHTNIEIEFVEGMYAQVRTAKVATGKDKTIFSLRSPYRYNNALNVVQSKAVTEIRLNNYGATHSIDLDGKMEENYRRLNIKYNQYLNEEDCRPSEAKAAIIGDLNNSLQNCLDITLVSIGDIEASQGSLYFTKSDHPSQFNFNVLSSGEKEVVDILLDLYLRQTEYTDTIFLIDEPELHINTSIQKKLLTEINRLVGENSQIWVATHSIGFLRALQEDLNEDSQIIHFPTGINWASTPQILSPMAKTRANWAKIFETALDDLTGLICPKRIIYCEGRDSPGRNGEERGLDAQVYNNVFSEKHHDTIFVSSGGNTELDQRSEIAFAILTKVFSDVEILVLKDRDISSGRQNTESDRQTYLGTNPQSHRVLKRWEIENYLYDKEVLKHYCASEALNFNEAAYDQFVTDINNQNLKDETNRIRNFCGITTSINPEVFNVALSKHISEGSSAYLELEKVIFERE